jgi:uncharacterized protein
MRDGIALTGLYNNGVLLFRELMMRIGFSRATFAAFVALSVGFAALFGVLTTGAKADPPAKPHRLLIQVDQNDPALMTLALNNATNLIDYYRAKHEDISVDVVAYGPGLMMLRADTSTMQDRIKQLKETAFPSTIQFSACNITKQGMEKKEGHPISLLAEAVPVPSGVVHLMEMQEQGWSYIRP